jgi:hypothetical protein
MCLGPEFFDDREALIRTREAGGDLEVERFMRAKRLRFDRLYELGYFEACLEGPTTADLFVHRVAEAARGFFIEERDLQLIFVRGEMARELGSRLRRGMGGAV